ncbi:MAG: type I secretion system permease/ATPase [Betaproteobacteria bacterium]|nr:type I secretion system permease/ATPase [Betaproteobacteria bacterium]MCL2887176.1 type I secretion system permease/ATPase [Betaproteobacteria bacterium]
MKNLTSPQASPQEMRLALQAQKPAFLHAAWFSIAIGLLMLSPSFYMLEVYDRVVNSRSVMTLAMLTLLLVLAYAVMECLQWARNGVLRHAAVGIDGQLASRVHEAVFQANLRGEWQLALRGLRDFAATRDFIASNALAALMDIPMAFSLVLVIFWIDPLLGWFTLASAILQGGITFFNQRASGALLAKAGDLNAQAQSFAQSALYRHEAALVMGMTDDLRQRWLVWQKDMLRHQAMASDSAGLYTALSKYVQQATGSLVLGLGGWLVITDTFASSVGMMLMASILAGRALAPLVQTILGWRNIAEAKYAFTRLENLLAAISAPKPSLSLPPPKGMLRAEQATVIPPGAAIPALRGISFTISPGQILAIVGPSAAGKSTLLHALTGAWPCAGGSIRLDGADVFAWDKRELGKYIGFLPQNTALFGGSIAENIARFGDSGGEELEHAARQVSVHDDILVLPEGYETDIGVEGERLSGGMRQRIGLARALYGNPRIIVLDEPDAHLDETASLALRETLRESRDSGATIVVATHRPRLLEIADWILVLAEGQQKGFGPGKEILAALRQPAVQNLKNPDIRVS